MKLDRQMLDEDGYPVDEALERIENWDYNDPNNLMAFVQSLWNFQKFETEMVVDDFDREHVQYTLHTCGWSGNEAIIRSLQKNEMFWFMNWYSSRRGGHHKFWVRFEGNGK